MTSTRWLTLFLLFVSLVLLIPGLFAPVLTIRGVLTRDGIAHVHLRLRLFKPTDPATWGMVVPAYRNRLDAAGLAAAQARTLLLPTVLAADSVLLRPWWATEGLGVGADDTRY